MDRRKKRNLKAKIIKAEKRVSKRIYIEMLRLEKDETFMAQLDSEIEGLGREELKKYQEEAWKKSKEEVENAAGT